MRCDCCDRPVLQVEYNHPHSYDKEVDGVHYRMAIVRGHERHWVKRPTKTADEWLKIIMKRIEER